MTNNEIRMTNKENSAALEPLHRRLAVSQQSSIEPSLLIRHSDFVIRHSLARSLLCAISLSVFFFAVYGTCTAITARRSDVGHAAFGWERFIPFVPVMIVPYMSVDLFFFAAPFVCFGRERELHVKRIICAITLAGICFLLFPLQMSMARPPLAGIFAPVFRFLYSFDKPFNLAPSLHIALRSLLWVIFVPRTRGVLRLGMQAWLILIGVSTLLTYQHQVLDLVTGQFLALFCLHLFPDGLGSAPVNRIAVRYGLGSIVLIAMAFVMRPWGLLLLWPAASLVLMASAYRGNGAAVFRKRGGRLAITTRIILGPYLLGARGALYLYRKREAPFVEVTPGLFIGRQLNRAEAAQLLNKGIASVLDLTAEHSEQPRLLTSCYLNLPILDLSPPTPQDLSLAVDFIGQHLHHGVYVHCALGYSRSACIAAAYLLWIGAAKDVIEATGLIRAIRPRIVLECDAKQALDEFLRRHRLNRTSP